MKADHEAAKEYAKIAVRVNYVTQSDQNLAAAYLELTEQLEAERKAREQANMSDTPVVNVAEALHASAPKGCKCADCAIDNLPCPTCYRFWWAGQKPGTNLIIADDSKISDLSRQLEESQAECERLRKDAERYRYLQAYGLTEDLHGMYGQHLDAAIDAAMRKREK